MFVGIGIGIPCSAISQGGADYIAQILGAGGLDYSEYDLARLLLLFQDTAGVTPVTTIGQTIGRANVKAKAAHNAQQATSSFRPQYQAAGAKFNGIDQNLLPDWLAQLGANCIFVRATIPATIAATQVLAGAMDAGPSNRLWLGVTVNGIPTFGVGSTSNSGGSDTRGKDVVLALTCNGATVKMYLDGVEVFSGAQSGTPTTTTPFRIGAMNFAGSAISYSGATVRCAVFGKVAPPLADIQKITTQLKALV